MTVGLAPEYPLTARRLRRLAVLAVLALLLGLLHAASHVHSPGEEKERSALAAHVCGACTALHAAGGPHHLTLPFWSASLLAFAEIASDSQPHSSPTSPYYRSRAPPFAA